MATSTIPGAVTTLLGYMAAVAAATTVTDVAVYEAYSAPISGMAYNYMAAGDYDQGLLFVPTVSEWASMGVAAKRRTENYALHGHVRTWAGGNDVASRLTDAFTLLNALQELIVSDPGGSGTLTPSGSWGAFNWRMEANGPLGDATGWGVVIGFELHVINAQLQG